MTEGEGITTLSPSPVMTDTFMGIPIRIARSGELPAIPINDIADGIDYDRSTLRQLFDRNSDLLKEFSGKVMIPTTDGGIQPHVCLTKEGVIGILMKLDYNRIKSPEKKKRIVEFQQWAIGKVNSEMHMQTRLVKEDLAVKEDWSSVAIGHIRLAKEFAAQNPTADPGMCLAIGIRNAERATGMDLSDYKKMIPPSPAQYREEWMTATQIGREIGRTAADVNRYLERWGFLYREDSTYYLTSTGAEYGKVFPGAFESGHLGYFIKWRRAVISVARMRQNSPTRIRD